MAAAAHAFPTLDLNGLKGTLNLSSDALKVLLVHSTSPAYTWNSTSQGHKTVTDFLGGSGAGSLTEETGSGYSRQALSSVTFTDTTNVTTLTCASPSWTASTISATYALFYDNTVGGTDGTNQILCYWDFGGTQATTSATFTLTISGSGLITWTNS